MTPASSIVLNNEIYARKQRGEDIITLSLGESFFDLPKIELAVTESSNHYVETAGRLALREKILSMEYAFKGSTEGGLSESNIIITAGAKLAILQALLVLSKGKKCKKVGYLEPAWVSYRSQIELAGLIPKSLPLNNFISDLDDIDALIVNNPHNPTGYEFSKEELSDIVKKCRQKKISIISDEVYSHYVTRPFYSLAELITEHADIIVVNSLSKNFGISGWRIGYLFAGKELISDLLSVQQHSLTCASVPVQDLLAANYDFLKAHTRTRVESVLERRSATVALLQSMGFEVMPGTATFYVFAKYPGTEAVDQHLTHLLDAGVAVVPGSGYGEPFSRYFRISCGVEPIERIESGLNIIKDILVKAR